MREDCWEPALDRVFELTLLLGRDMTANLARMGLTEARAHLLWELRALGPCPQRELASALHVTPRAVTALVDGLVETGFVTREPRPGDRRSILVTLTERGRATTQTMVDGKRNLARQLFAGLPAETFDGFDASLDHVIKRLRVLLAGPAQTAGRELAQERADGGGEGGRIVDPREVRGPGLDHDGRVVE